MTDERSVLTAVDAGLRSAERSNAAAPRSRGTDRVWTSNLLRSCLLTVGPTVVAAIALASYLSGGRWVTTDDAYVRANIVSIADSVSGTVAEVFVVDNQIVKAGQPLFKLDDEAYRLALESAKAEVNLVANQFSGVKASYYQALQQIEQAKADLTLAEATGVRQDALVARAAASQAALDQATHDLNAARHRLIAAESQANSLLAQLGGSAVLPLELYPPYQQATAQVAVAERNLRHTLVVAPTDAMLANVDALRPGDYLNASQTALSMVATDQLWVEADLKETDLTFLKIGDPAIVKVDAYPGREMRATVVAINPATASEFAALPAQNATGNWVKVVQRVPVRLSLEVKPDDPVLRAGFSVTVEIDTGHRRSLAQFFGFSGS